MMMLVVPRLSARRLSVGGLRLYEVGGALYPSVTTILGVVSKPGLVAWARRTALEAVREFVAQGLSIEVALQRAAQEPERQREAAAQRGTDIHAAIAAALSGESYPPEAGPWVEGALTFLAEAGLEPVAHEAVLVSRAHGFAGTCDVAMAGRDGQPALLDWKTGGLYPEHALQLGAYAIALEEMTGQGVAAAWAVGLREGRVEARQVALPAAKDGFLAALALWRALRSDLFVEVGG